MSARVPDSHLAGRLLRDIAIGPFASHVVEHDMMIVDLDGNGWLKQDAMLCDAPGVAPSGSFAVTRKAEGFVVHLDSKSGVWTRQQVSEELKKHYISILMVETHN